MSIQNRLRSVNKKGKQQLLRYWAHRLELEAAVREKNSPALLNTPPPRPTIDSHRGVDTW